MKFEGQMFHVLRKALHVPLHFCGFFSPAKYNNTFPSLSHQVDLKECACIFLITIWQIKFQGIKFTFQNYGFKNEQAMQNYFEKFQRSQR